MLEPATPTWHIALPRGATAVPIARAMVRTALQDLRVAADRHIAQLLTSELVSNALQHTCGTKPIELVVELQPTGCVIEVHDDDPLLIDVLLDDPFPLSEPGDAVLVSAPDDSGPGWAAAGSTTAEGAPSGEGAPSADEVPAADAVPAAGAADGAPAVDAADKVPAADGARTVDGHRADGYRAAGYRAAGYRAADDRLPAQRTGCAGRADDAGRSGGDEGGGAGESAEAGGTEASTGTRTTATRTAPGTPIVHAADAACAAEATGQGPHGHDDHRRGLLLLRSLSSDAGCRRTPRGKAVWFTLPEVPRRRR
ncbi:ATP-binding protein [Streptomyces sioyaensis]|uniref:ATP-binding protein n=1 Tax=Streptomyces sioyaensis TaxID=67364 RepID=UPI0037996CAE